VSDPVSGEDPAVWLNRIVELETAINQRTEEGSALTLCPRIRVHAETAHFGKDGLGGMHLTAKRK
jgi:hypothetical protein